MKTPKHSPKLRQNITTKLMNFERRLAGLERKTARLDGMDMVYYENQTPRSKPTLVLIHGYTADKSLWHRLAKVLGNNYHLIIPDMAGHGETPYRPDGHYDIPTQTAWLAKLLDQLGLEQVHLIGSSMGGFISANFAAHHPQATLSATLLDPAGITSPELSDIALAYQNGRNMFLPETQSEFLEFMDMVMAKPPYVPKFVVKTMGDAHIARRDRYAHIFNDFFDKDMLEDKLALIKAPVLLIWGKQDRILHVSAASIWQDGIANCKTIIWDDLGHVPNLEATKRTANTIEDFLMRALGQ